MELYPQLQQTAQSLANDFSQLSEERKELLRQLASYISRQLAAEQPVQLNFICTHNSRRSHIAQLWAQAAAGYYGISPVTCFSGGTEATAFNLNAVQAMQELGFQIQATTTSQNPVYAASYAPGQPDVQVWSKEVTDAANPNSDFAAIMTCSSADQNCPIVPGAAFRLALTYSDPKAFDGTPQQAEKYLERARQIGTELLYAFSLVASS